MKEGGERPRWRKPVMMPRTKPLPRLLMLLACVLSMTGCAPASTRWLTPQPPEIPALPKEAQQGPTPSICLPTCSAGLAVELKSLRELQTAPASRD
ncbi:hypothetical protein AVE30378_04858 [Achromobacter veterisilvae]|uniref:Uncharacterized protein n=1 Tax=Achromobacter veterisilvae TaxID=2069367 RepID=A0A446CVT6_9BURK|nr:hypothetical protein AVE30378_04858 [Achromobacter veterisilvae]